MSKELIADLRGWDEGDFPHSIVTRFRAAADALEAAEDKIEMLTMFYKTAEAKLERIAALHHRAMIYELNEFGGPDRDKPFRDYCEECTPDRTVELIEDCEWNEDCETVWYPCPTAQILEGEGDGN